MDSNLAEVIAFPRNKLLHSTNPPAPPRHRPSPRIEHLSQQQLLGLLAQAKATSVRDWILFLVSYWHGLRASEAVNLTAANFADGYLTIQRLKGSLRTRQPLVDHQNSLLNERTGMESWLSRRSTMPGPLFHTDRFGFYYLVRKHGASVGLPRHLCHPHIFKHSIAIHSIPGAGVENVRQYLGHRCLSSTGEYLRVSDDAASRAVSQALIPHLNYTFRGTV